MIKTNMQPRNHYALPGWLRVILSSRFGQRIPAQRCHMPRRMILLTSSRQLTPSDIPVDRSTLWLSRSLGFRGYTHHHFVNHFYSTFSKKVYLSNKDCYHRSSALTSFTFTLRPKSRCWSVSSFGSSAVVAIH